MNQLNLRKNTHNQTNKVGRKVKLTIETLSPEERLNTLADAIIERILEERNKAPAV